MGPSGIVILYARAGSLGHAVLAANYERALRDRGYAVESADVLELDGGILVEALKALYAGVLTGAPALWRAFYTKWGHIPGAGLLRFSVVPGWFRNVSRFLEERRPALVLTTHPYATAAASRWKRRSRFAAPLFTALSEWHFQEWWRFPEVDHYLASSAAQRAGMIAAGCNPRQVTVSGLLVSPAFSRRTSKRDARIRLELPLDREVLLLAGGGQGWGIESIANAVARLRRPVFTAVLCGSGRRLLRSSADPTRIRLLPFQEDPSLYFHAADLLVSKPGGLTMAEAFHAGLPAFSAYPLAGHEEANQCELARAGAVLTQKPGEDLAESIESALSDPLRLAESVRCATRLIVPDAASILFRLVEDYVPEYNAPIRSVL